MAWLHRLAILLAGATLVLVVLGALVTSAGAGLSVPAWPSTFGDAGGAAGVAIQQAHRVAAAVVGFLALLVAIGAWRVDSRPWLRALAFGMLATGTAQAVYGGIGVLNLLPAFISLLHAALAQLFLALTVAIAVYTSPGWLERAARQGAADASLRRWAVAAAGVIYLQVVIGAAMRHTYAPDGRPAGFAIPDFPLAFGRLLPPAGLLSWAVGLGLLHRAAALAALIVVALAATRVFRVHAADEDLVRPAALLGLVLVAQVALGGMAVLSGGSAAVSTTHAGAVAVALGAALVLAIRSSVPAVAALPAARSSRRSRQGANE